MPNQTTPSMPLLRLQARRPPPWALRSTHNTGCGGGFSTASLRRVVDVRVVVTEGAGGGVGIVGSGRGVVADVVFTETAGVGHRAGGHRRWLRCFCCCSRNCCGAGAEGAGTSHSLTTVDRGRLIAVVVLASTGGCAGKGAGDIIGGGGGVFLIAGSANGVGCSISNHRRAVTGIGGGRRVTRVAVT